MCVCIYKESAVTTVYVRGGNSIICIYTDSLNNINVYKKVLLVFFALDIKMYRLHLCLENSATFCNSP